MRCRRRPSRRGSARMAAQRLRRGKLAARLRMTYSLNTLTRLRRAGGRRRAPAPARFAHEIALVLGVVGPGVLAAGAGQLLRAGPGLLHLRQRRAPCATGAAASAPGWPTAATSCSASRSGGALPPACAPGWRRWRAGCAAAKPLPPAGSRAGSRSRAGLLGRRWRCCCAPARRWSGRGCTASKAALPDHAGGALGYLVGPAGREVAGLHRLRPGVRRAGGAGRGAGVPLLLEPRGRAHRRAHRRLHRVAPREARDRAGPGVRPAGRARARGDRARRAHRDRGAPSRRRC